LTNNLLILGDGGDGFDYREIGKLYYFDWAGQLRISVRRKRVLL